MSKDVILTGIRANNDLHIGNYFGALLPIVDMAKNKSTDYQINLFVPDLHSFTTPIDHSQLRAQIMNNLKLFVAAGLPLDNESVRIYRQSYIPAHSELTVILNNFTRMGVLRRMTQFSDKSGAKQALQTIRNEVAHSPKKPLSGEFMEEFNKSIANFYSNFDIASVGLYDYPVLMAADILLYGAKYVPVGDDQTQHLEFTRDIAERMNKQFGELFVIPEPVAKQHEFFGKDQGLRIKDLVNPTKKMSKSDDSGKGVIFLGDSPEGATKKIMAATTDNLNSINRDPINQPGVNNLLDFFMYFRNVNASYRVEDPRPDDGYAELKRAVSTVVAKFLTDFQAKLANVDEAAILHKLESDEAAMNKVANQTLAKVQKAVGLRP